MFKVSNFCASLYFYLAVFCPSKGYIFQCCNGCLVPSEEMYDFISPCKDGMNAEQCYYHDKWDFENELYKMINNGKSSTNWARSNGITITGSPHSDHSGNNTAHFLTLPSRRVQSPAVLRIGVIFASSNQLTCQLSFYYWIGQVDGIVTVGLWSPSDRTINTIWQERSGIKNQWQRTVLIINNTLNTEVLQLSIQGQIFEPWVPGETIAIDDLSVTEGCLLAFDHRPLYNQLGLFAPTGNGRHQTTSNISTNDWDIYQAYSRPWKL